MKAEIRKLAVFLEETHAEMGRGIAPPTRKAAAVAVIANPYAGVYAENLDLLMEIGAGLGGLPGARWRGCWTGWRGRRHEGQLARCGVHP